MKKIFAFGLSLAMLVSVFTACGESGKSQETTSGTTTEATTSSVQGTEARENVTLKWSAWDPEPKEFIKAFNDSHPDTKVEYEMLSSDQYINIINVRLLSGEGPDIFGSRFPSNYDTLIKDGNILELTGKPFLNNIEPSALAQVTTADGKVYGFPSSTLWYLVYYNKDIFKKYNLQLPTNWEEYVAVCEELKKNGVAPQIQGMKDLFQNEFVAVSPILSASLVDPKIDAKLLSGEAKFSDDILLKHFKRVEDFLKKGYLYDGSLGLTMIQAWQLFTEGKAAMMQGGTYYTAQTFPQFKPNFDYGIMPVPYNVKGESQKMFINATASNKVINAKGENVERTLEFVEWWNQKENLELYANSSLSISTGKGIVADFAPELKLYAEQMNNSAIEKRPVVKYPSEVSNEVGVAIQSMIIGKSADEAIKVLQNKMDEVVAAKKK